MTSYPYYGRWEKSYISEIKYLVNSPFKSLCPNIRMSITISYFSYDLRELYCNSDKEELLAGYVISHTNDMTVQLYNSDYMIHTLLRPRVNLSSPEILGSFIKVSFNSGIQNLCCSTLRNVNLWRRWRRSWGPGSRAVCTLQVIITTVEPSNENRQYNIKTIIL